MLDAVGDDAAPTPPPATGAPPADVHGVEGLFRRSYAELVHLAALVTGDRSVAEDVVQDAFAALYRRVDPLEDPTALEGYVRRSVVNGSRDRLRRRAVERRPRAAVPVAIPTPEARVEADDDARAVTAAVAALPVRQRECVAWHLLVGLTHAEVASVLGISTGSVKTHLHRATRTLARTLEERR